MSKHYLKKETVRDKTTKKLQKNKLLRKQNPFVIRRKIKQEEIFF